MIAAVTNALAIKKNSEFACFDITVDNDSPGTWKTRWRLLETRPKRAQSMAAPRWNQLNLAALPLYRVAVQFTLASS